MGVEENKAAIQRFLSREVFFGGSLEVVDEVFASDVVLLDPVYEAQVEGTKAIKIIKDELTSYERKDGEIIILEPQIAEGESVATRYTLEVDGITYGGVTVSRFADGKIQEYLVAHGVNWYEEEEERRAHN
jgi:SnoaL-like domain